MFHDPRLMWAVGIFFFVVVFVVFYLSALWLNRHPNSPTAKKVGQWDAAKVADVGYGVAKVDFSLDVVLRYIPLLLLVIVLQSTKATLFVLALILWGFAHFYLTRLWREGLRNRREAGRQLCILVFRVRVLSALCFVAAFAKQFTPTQWALVALAFFGMLVPEYALLLGPPRFRAVFEQDPQGVAPVLLNPARKRKLWAIVGFSIVAGVACFALQH